jgi:hypothetical protein
MVTHTEQTKGWSIEAIIYITKRITTENNMRKLAAWLVKAANWISAFWNKCKCYWNKALLFISFKTKGCDNKLCTCKK